MARKLAIDESAVAQAVLVTLLGEDQLELAYDNLDIVSIAEHVLDAAEVEYKPTARKLVLTFDLSGVRAVSDVNAEYVRAVSDVNAEYVPADRVPGEL